MSSLYACPETDSLPTTSGGGFLIARTAGLTITRVHSRNLRWRVKSSTRWKTNAHRITGLNGGPVDLVHRAAGRLDKVLTNRSVGVLLEPRTRSVAEDAGPLRVLVAGALLESELLRLPVRGRERVVLLVSQQ